MNANASVQEYLIDQIAKAWEGVPYPGDYNIFTPDSYDDEGITEYFSGTSWRGHTVAALRAHYSAISTFFAPTAYHYWLPAYLIAAVEDPDELSQGISSLIHSLSPDGCDHKERIAFLTNKQRIAVIGVVEYIAGFYEHPDYPEGTRDEKSVLRYLYSITSMA